MSENQNQGLLTYVALGVAAVLAAVGLAMLLLRKRKPRSFREDPIGALKDRGEIFADKAQEATEEALTRLQETLDEIRERLPEVNRKRLAKRRKRKISTSETYRLTTPRPLTAPRTYWLSQ